ncbi:hypothetical protein Ahy_A05g022556 [Arachis hypogaea]|uniref:AHK4/CRE1/WOL first receiver domain-containing protein n=1 Tax=Arachis hypogaea TaxID=3818 RepID=A0A445D0Z8_ARAHY|nr:hypothetical protein Ahy_A05g022556 [Arachis hypogaea]
MSEGCNSKTLSGCEVANEWNNWDNFKHLIADEEFLFDGLVKKVASSEYYEQITLMKLNMKNLPSSFRGLKAIVVNEKPVRAAVTRYHLTRFGIQAKVANHIKKAVLLCGKNSSLTSDWKQNGYMLKISQMILLVTNTSNVEFDKFSYLSCFDSLC